MVTVVRTVRGGEPFLRVRGIIASRCVYHGILYDTQEVDTLYTLSGSGHTRKHICSFEAVIHMQKRENKVPKSTSQMAPSRMHSLFTRLAEHFTVFRAYSTRYLPGQ